MNDYTFTFYYFSDAVVLKIWSRHGTIYNQQYPLTYTIQECIEDWCENIGYGFISHTITDILNNTKSGTFNVK